MIYSTTGLDQLIAEAIEQSGEDDPGAIAEFAVDMLDPFSLAAHLRAALAEVIRLRSISTTGGTRGRPPLPRDQAATTEPASRPRASVKQQMIRNHWAAFLAQEVTIGGTSRRLADASAIELRLLAGENRDKASKLMTRSRQIEALAAAVEARSLPNLASLDEQTAAHIMRGVS